MRAAGIAGLAGVVHGDGGVPVADVDHHAEGGAGSLLEVAAVARVADRVGGTAAGRRPDVGESAEFTGKVGRHRVTQFDPVQVAPAPGGGIGTQVPFDIVERGLEAAEEHFVACGLRRTTEPGIRPFDDSQQVLILHRDRVFAGLKRRRHPSADFGIQMPSPPDLEERCRGAVGGEFSVPAGKNLQRRPGLRGRCQLAKQREQAAGRNRDVVGL